MDTDHTQISDEELIEQILSGKEEVFDTLTKRYQAKLERYVTRLTNSAVDVSDIVQESFVRAHKSLANFDTSRKFSSWMYRITHNVTMDFMNAHNKRNEVSLEESYDDKGYQADMNLRSLDAWYEGEIRDDLQRAVESLPDEYREIIYLKYIDGFSYAEIAEILDKPVGTVGTHLGRAKKKLLVMMLEDK